MWQKERHQRISSLLQALGQVTKEQLTKELNVSRETIRRDLLEMEKLGLVNCVHGGVTAIPRTKEPPLKERTRLHTEEKRAIAREARKLVKQGDTIFLDCGTTTSLLAHELSTVHELHIITNSIEAATIIRKANETSLINNTITLLGGNLGKFSAATLGNTTIREITRYHTDFAMLSPMALHPKYGAMSYDPEEAEIAQAMSENASKIIILADHSKFQNTGRVSYCPINQIDKLIVGAQVESTSVYLAIKSLVREVCIAN